VALLALIGGQDVEPAEGSDGTDGRRQIARQVAADRVVSTVDPDARHVRKTWHRRQDGYKAHVAIEPGTGLFTSGRLTKAAGEDNHEAVAGLELLDREDAGSLSLHEHDAILRQPSRTGHPARTSAKPAGSTGRPQPPPHDQPRLAAQGHGGWIIPGPA